MTTSEAILIVGGVYIVSNIVVTVFFQTVVFRWQIRTRLRMEEECAWNRIDRAYKKRQAKMKENASWLTYTTPPTKDIHEFEEEME